MKDLDINYNLRWKLIVDLGLDGQCWDVFGFGFDWYVVRRIDLRIE
jgi:hypothetical protein